MPAHAQTDEAIKNESTRLRSASRSLRRTKSLHLPDTTSFNPASPSDVVPELVGAPLKPSPSTDDGFHAVFGVLGIPMQLAFVLSAVAMFYLAYVQVYPTHTANILMNTADLDHGEFWLLNETPRAHVVVATVALVLFGFSYIALVAFMLCFRHRALSHAHAARLKPKAAAQPRKQNFRFSIQPLLRRHMSTKPSTNTNQSSHQGHKQANSASMPLLSRFRTLLVEFTGIQGAYHCYYNAFFDLPKLIFQTHSLMGYLDKGFPLPLIYFYATLLLINWLISFYRFQRRSMDRKLVVMRLFYLFDLFFAVFSPIVVLAYAYHQFQIDRKEFAMREEVLSLGSYDRIARLFADPVQLSNFRDGFSNMQLTNTSYIVAKICLNTLVLYKWRKILINLIQQQHLEVRQRQFGGKQPQSSTVIRFCGPQRKRHRLCGTLLFFSGIAFVITFTIVAITSSQRNCAPFQQCRVMAYEWHWGDSACPCVAFIDRNERPATYDAWIDPVDVTHELTEAARTGRLETVQIINRAVPILPEELQKCRSFQQLTLVYSRTQALPSWVQTFSHLQHLHIESDFLHYPLHTLPPDLFVNMKQLRFLRVGGAATLQEFPSLQGLKELTTLVISIPRALTTLPAFDDLKQLVILYIGDATHVRHLPSLQPLENLKSFSLLRRNAMCCNGFITGTCDLTDFQCKPRANEDPVTCETGRINTQDLELINSIDHFLCSANLTTDLADSEPTRESTDGLCNGVLYRQCTYNGQQGICYNTRMQVVHCDVFGEYEQLRRREIAMNVGPPCNSSIEDWLGCDV